MKNLKGIAGVGLLTVAGLGLSTSFAPHVVRADNVNVRDVGGLITGVWFMYQGFQEINRGNILGGGITGWMGFSTAAGAVTIARAATPESEDAIKVFSRTAEYDYLKSVLGDRRARQFSLDTDAGFTQSALEAKYPELANSKVSPEAIYASRPSLPRAFQAASASGVSLESQKQSAQ